jgi:hypothetical protein
MASSIAFPRNAASILFEAKAPQPPANVHDGAHSASCGHDR